MKGKSRELAQFSLWLGAQRNSNERPNMWIGYCIFLICGVALGYALALDERTTMATEVWKDVEGFEGVYQVSDLGHIRSLDRTVKSPWGRDKKLKGKIIQPRQGRKRATPLVSLCHRGNRRDANVAPLVLSAFVGPRPDPKKSIVIHANGNIRDNRLANLSWGTK